MPWVICFYICMEFTFKNILTLGKEQVNYIIPTLEMNQPGKSSDEASYAIQWLYVPWSFLVCPKHNSSITCQAFCFCQGAKQEMICLGKPGWKRFQATRMCADVLGIRSVEICQLGLLMKCLTGFNVLMANVRGGGGGERMNLVIGQKGCEKFYVSWMISFLWLRDCIQVVCGDLKWIKSFDFYLLMDFLKKWPMWMQYCKGLTQRNHCISFFTGLTTLCLINAICLITFYNKGISTNIFVCTLYITCNILCCFIIFYLIDIC